MIKDDFLPAIFIVLVKWTIFSHFVSGKHVVIKIHVPKLINHQHHTNLVLVHKYKKPTHHHVVPHHHHDDHYYHHHYGYNHHHGHHHHQGSGHKGGHHVPTKHHKTPHGKPDLHHHSHSSGHHGHPPVHHKPQHPKTDPKKHPEVHKPTHYAVGRFFSAYKHEPSKESQPIQDDQFETITDVPKNSHDFEVEDIKTTPEVQSSYEVHEDHPHDYSSDYYNDKTLNFPFENIEKTRELKEYTEDYNNPVSVAKFTSNIEHGSINLEENHYNPEQKSEINDYLNEYNESDYDD